MKAEKKDKSKRQSVHIEFADKIIALLKAGTAPWQKPWHPGDAIAVPHNPVSGTIYRGMNRVNLAISDYEDPRWMTLKQANSQDLQIIPGSKATPIIFYQFSKEENQIDEEGNSILGEDGKPLKTKVELVSPIVRIAHVFNGEQIENMPPLKLTDKSFQWDSVDKAESILTASGASIKHDQSNRAYYSPVHDEIHIPPKANFDAPDKYYATIMHELGHWTGHTNRLNREGGPFGSELYAKEELRAEIASWMLAQEIGISHNPEQHASYVQSWVKILENDPNEIIRACRDAEQIKEYIITLELKKELDTEQQEKPMQYASEENIAATILPSNQAKEKTFLNVPYKEKEQAKRLGARWDKDQKSWYALEGTDLSKLTSWLTEKASKTFDIPNTLTLEDEIALNLKISQGEVSMRSAIKELKLQSEQGDEQILLAKSNNNLNGCTIAHCNTL